MNTIQRDPYVSTEIAAALIEGVQSKNVGTSVKHFVANNQEKRRMTNSSDADERTLREIYLASFEGAIKKSKTMDGNEFVQSYQRRICRRQ